VLLDLDAQLSASSATLDTFREDEITWRSAQCPSAPEAGSNAAPSAAAARHPARSVPTPAPPAAASASMAAGGGGRTSAVGGRLSWSGMAMVGVALLGVLAAYTMPLASEII